MPPRPPFVDACGHRVRACFIGLAVVGGQAFWSPASTRVAGRIDHLPWPVGSSCGAWPLISACDLRNPAIGCTVPTGRTALVGPWAPEVRRDHAAFPGSDAGPHGRRGFVVAARHPRGRCSRYVRAARRRLFGYPLTPPTSLATCPRAVILCALGPRVAQGYQSPGRPITGNPTAGAASPPGFGVAHPGPTPCGQYHIGGR